ncbi:hypothetical protein [Celeribacter ethanolicus]|uniref:hypothetical protein n=1 Tax=Celeribacter ethanolicus TaxID=1758178 RepID=UPI0018E09E1B|nr:hypothetical protein [Celeribacter ethanolicus]
MADVFSGGKQSGPPEAEVKEFHTKIGRLVIENDFYPKGSRSESREETRDDRSAHSSTIMIAQCLPKEWYDYINAPLLADAFMDRTRNRAHLLHQARNVNSVARSGPWKRAAQ